jgi:hypothetical protein
MKRNIIMVAILIASLLTANIASYADETNSSQPNFNLSTLQRNLLTIQAQQENAKATGDCATQAINIKFTYKGTATGMNSAGTACVSTPVTLIISTQCGNFAKGTITALGVTVPVTGVFKNNSLSLDGVKTGTTIYEAYLGAYFISPNFMVSSFDFGKYGSTTNNRYDYGWTLIKQ